MAGQNGCVLPTAPFPCSSDWKKVAKETGGKTFCLNGKALLLIKSNAEQSTKIELELHDHV